ncbi:hypothetical protein [Herbidospora cretacea]|uniref:hypothetical protein n=1 Tax=Herbidospora cretacea TaxID=28444 RepID=UPI000AA39ED8|nr:hypothetical protein [Herbidospora cretacea]
MTVPGHRPPVRADLARHEGAEELHLRATASGRPIDAVTINAGKARMSRRMSEPGGGD